MRKAFSEQVQAGAIGHGGGDGNDLVVVFRLFDQRLGKDLGVAGRVGGGLFLLPRDHVELRPRMTPVRGFFCGIVAFALFR